MDNLIDFGDSINKEHYQSDIRSLLPIHKENFLLYLSETDEPAVRRVLYKYGYPIEQRGNGNELFELAVILCNDYPESYFDFLMEHPQYSEIENIILKRQQQTIKTNKITTQPKDNTNLILIGLVAIAVVLIFKK